MQNLKLIYGPLLLLCVLTLTNHSRSYSLGRSLLFNNIKVRDGLPVNEVFTLSQDSSGFIWMGTINGIVPYDGYEMKIFRKDCSRAIELPDNQITSLVHDSKLCLWAGSYEGLTYFNTKNNHSELVDLGKPREVRCLLLQSDSILWIGTADGLIRLNTHTRSYSILNEKNSKLGSNIIRSLYIDSDHTLWIGTFNGLNSLSANGTMHYYNLKGSYKPELKNNLILDIQPYAKGNDNRLWIGTETGLVLFDRETGQKRTFNSENTGFGNEVVKCILPVENGELYFGTDFGFYFFDSKSGEFSISLHDPFNNYSLANNVVWDIFQDQSGIIWLSTANGISQLNTGQSMFHFTPVVNKTNEIHVGNQVNDLYCDNNQSIWMATKSGVVAHHRNGETTTFTNQKNERYPLVFNNINTISGDHLGRIWIGSAGGINIWDAQQKRMHTITADFNLNRGLRSNYISAFIAPSDGSFWVSTWGGGLYKAKGNFSQVDEIYFEYIADFNTNTFSTDNKIWLENKNMIYTIELSTMQIEEVKPVNELIKKKDINSILISSKGELWIGLTNQLLRFNLHSNAHTFFEVIAGEESNINNLAEDYNGNIWGTTLTSVFRLLPATGEVESFMMSKGIPLDVFITQSNCQSPEGNIYLGGNDGYITFNPREIRKNMFCPRTIITGIKVNNKPIEHVEDLKGRNRSANLVSYHDKIVLRYDQHSVSISFSSLHYGNPHRNLYAYKLEGHDKDWNYTTGFQNVATYSNLPPDKYLFKVKGTNNDGVWFDNEAILQVIVKPPFWASAWAIVLYIILFQAVLTMLFITYRNRVRYKAEINAIVLEKEKNEELALAKQQFFTNISHEFRTPLNLIVGPVQTLMQKFNPDQEAKMLLLLISRNSRRLVSLVNQLIDIRKIETKTLRVNLQPIGLKSFCKEQYELFADLAASRMIDFRFDAPDEEIMAISDPEKLESLIQNLLSNAFKYTERQGKVILKLDSSAESRVRIGVSDTGAGILPEDQPYVFNRFYQGKNSKGDPSGYGIGLNLAKEYCERLGGTINFESIPGQGSDFWFEIPVEITEQQAEPSTPFKNKETDRPNPEQLAVARPQNIVYEPLPVVLLVDDNPDPDRLHQDCIGFKVSFFVFGKQWERSIGRSGKAENRPDHQRCNDARNRWYCFV
jgi:signal transduction histidine kinase/ligand-binding sensor domain-containing protein